MIRKTRSGGWALTFALIISCRAEASSPQLRASLARTASSSDVAHPPAVVDTEVHGRLQTIDGVRVLNVWGTPREMGFAQGFLLRDAIIDVLDGYALQVITPSRLDVVSPLYDSTADVSTRLRREAEGIVEGMNAAGGAFIPGLDRDLAPVDLLVMGAMTDLVAIGCSSISAWGASTMSSADGAPVVARNLDWSDDPALLRNQVVVVYEPAEESRQPVVSVSFAGYLGCLSCINEDGVTALFNMGYGEGAATPVQAAANGFAPANLLIRDVLEQGSTDDGDAVEKALRDATHAGSFIVHVLEPTGPSPARILEVEADGLVVRRDGIPGTTTVLAATNHLRAKEGPQSCRRYASLSKASRTRDHVWDDDSLWGAARRVRLADVVHTLLVRPRTRTLRVWLRQPEESARARAHGAELRWDALVRVPSTP